MVHIVSASGSWANLSYEIRLQLMHNHLLALHQRGVVNLSQDDVFRLSEQYVVGSTGKYPWELLYWGYNGEIGAAIGLCTWTCGLCNSDHTLPGIDECFASPNLGRATQYKNEFLMRLCECMDGQGDVIEIGRAHNLFREKNVRRSVSSDARRIIRGQLKSKVNVALGRGERLTIIMFTPASFYDPFDKGIYHLLDPGLLLGNGLIRWLADQGFPVRDVIVATSLDGMEGLPCCGKELKEMVYEIWEIERVAYKEYGARKVKLLEYETIDGQILGMKWPYDYASRTWKEYGQWLSTQEKSLKVLVHAISFMRRSQLAPFPWRLSAFVF